MTITEKDPKERLVDLVKQKMGEITGDVIRSAAEEIANMEDDEITDLLFSISDNLTLKTQQEVLEVSRRAAQEQVAAEVGEPHAETHTVPSGTDNTYSITETVPVKKSEDKDISDEIEEMSAEEQYEEAEKFVHQESYGCPNCGFETSSQSEFTMVNYEGGSSGRRVWMCPRCKTLLK